MEAPIYAPSISRVWRERIIKYRLIGGYCEECGKRFYPYRKICPRCGSDKVKQVKLPDRGKILAYSVVRSPPREFAYYSPYVVAIVELEDGTRLIAQVTDVNPEDLAPGMPVEAVFRRYREQGEKGIIEYGVKFRPIA